MNRNDLRDQSSGIEERTIRQQFTPDELEGFRENFTENELKKEDVEDAFSLAKKGFKEQLKTITETSTGLKTKLRKKYQDKIVEVYCVPNFNDGEMEFYDTQTGEKVDSRKLRPDERQMTIAYIDKSGTNG